MSHHFEPSTEQGPAAHEHKPHRRQLHRTWWFWLAVVLMLAAMLLYGLAADWKSSPAQETGAKPQAVLNVANSWASPV